MMRAMKLRSTLLGTALGAVLAACGGGAGDESPSAPASSEASPPAAEATPIELTLWHAIAQEHEAALNDIIQAFQADHPNVRVNATYQGGYRDLRTALFAAMASTSRPVMSQLYESWTTEFMEQDLIVPVQDFIDAAGAEATADLQDFFPGFLANNTWDGRAVTLPFNKSVYMLYVNLDRLEAAGLALPETWADLREVCRALTDTAANRYGFGSRPFIEAFTPFFLMNGGEFFTGDRLNLDGQASIETLDLLLQMKWADNSMFVEENYLTQAFASQTVAIFVGSSAGLPYTEDAVGQTFRWTVAPLPSNGDHPRQVLSQGTNVGIINGHSPEVTNAAWQFLHFLTNSENSAHFAAVSGYMPVRRSSLQVPELQEKLAADPNLGICASQLEYAAFEPRMPEWESVRGVLDAQMSQIFNNRTTDAAAVAANMQRRAAADLGGE